MGMQVPPVPPVPPDPHVFIQTGVPSWFGFVAAVALVVVGMLLWPFVRALARRLEGRGADDAFRAELDEVQARLGDLEHMEARVAELENRVEFSERLLTRSQQEGERLGEGGA
jgi:flagellar biosynthesis/type III secretory pathway M-ring protein FliF/YscJ